jgi:hypothetical protein
VVVTELVLERRGQEDTSPTVGVGGGVVMITPMIDEDYWAYRVRLTETQSVLGFPKFGTVGIGFAKEEDWNTNLPYTCDADEIREHIWHNRGDESITAERVYEAIRMIQRAVIEDWTP